MVMRFLYLKKGGNLGQKLDKTVRDFWGLIFSKLFFLIFQAIV